MKYKTAAAVLSVLLAALLLALSGCGVKPDRPAATGTAAADTPTATGDDPASEATATAAAPTGGGENGPAEVHNAGNDTYSFIEARVESPQDGIVVTIEGYSWLRWFGLTPEDIAAEKTECAKTGLDFTIKVKTTPFKTVKLAESQMEDEVCYLVLDGSDEEREHLAEGTLSLWSPSELTYGSKTVSAPMGRYKFQPLPANGQLSDAALADGDSKTLVEESRTDTEVVFHYEYNILVYKVL
ncbi:MAG: hypothetical protein IKI42_02615 [Clostridia bacterium]|nr:hypothetical protein [Clostridia bacterium]